MPLPPETRIGHFHIYVADLDETMHFYHHLLGFDDMGIGRDFRMGMVSIAGYHHHIGFNTWQGQGAPPPPPNSLGMRYFNFILSDQAELERVRDRLQRAGISFETSADSLTLRDPSQNVLVLSLR